VYQEGIDSRRGSKWFRGALAVLAGIAVFTGLIAAYRRVPATELTIYGTALVTGTGIAAGIFTLLFLSFKSVSGSNLEHLTYLRQTHHKRWLRLILLASVFFGAGAALFGHACIGQLMELLPAQQYTSVRARVIERSRNERDAFSCQHELEVEAEDATRLSLCLDRGVVWASIPDHLKRVAPGDWVIVHLRRTVLGSSAEIVEVAVPGQDFYIE
jgi:hypothetical protein